MTTTSDTSGSLFLNNNSKTTKKEVSESESMSSMSTMELLRDDSFIVDSYILDNEDTLDMTTRSEPLFIDHDPSEPEVFATKNASYTIFDDHHNNILNKEDTLMDSNPEEDTLMDSNPEEDTLMDTNPEEDTLTMDERSSKETTEQLELVCSSQTLSSSGPLSSSSTSSKTMSSVSSVSSSSSSWLTSLTGVRLQKRSLAALLDAIALQRSSVVRSQRALDPELKMSSRGSDLSATSNSVAAVSVLDNRQVESDGDEDELLDQQDQPEEDAEGLLQPGSQLRRTTRLQRKPSPHPQAYFTVDSRRMTTRYKRSARDRKLLFGIKQFNLDASKGIEYLVSNAFLESDDAKGVARFLFREKRLSKRQIGKYIGAHEEFNQRVLKEFVHCHEFTHLILVQALRQFLWSFRLPGEAMQIDRVMESFASRYCDQNPDLFETPDTCYILCFSIIMLNTALHNPSVRKKMSVEEFVKQNKGIDSGQDLPRDILELIYRSIKEEAFRIPTETHNDLLYTFFAPEKAGWLLKQGGSWKSWKKRWFVLSDRVLYYFTNTSDNVPKGIIPLENVKVRMVEDVDGKNFCLEIFSDSDTLIKGCKTDSKGTVVQGKHKSYRMSASSADDRSGWLQSVQRSIRTHPFHDVILRKKANLRRNNLNRTINSKTSEVLDLSHKST